MKLTARGASDEARQLIPVFARPASQRAGSKVDGPTRLTLLVILG
jgi:hypothetical protein